MVSRRNENASVNNAYVNSPLFNIFMERIFYGRGIFVHLGKKRERTHLSVYIRSLSLSIDKRRALLHFSTCTKCLARKNIPWKHLIKNICNIFTVNLGNTPYSIFFSPVSLALIRFLSSSNNVISGGIHNFF